METRFEEWTEARLGAGVGTRLGTGVDTRLGTGVDTRLGAGVPYPQRLGQPAEYAQLAVQMIENRMQIIAASASRPAPSTTVSAM